METNENYDKIRSILELIKSSLQCWKSDFFAVVSAPTEKNPKEFINTLLLMSDSCRDLEILILQVEEKANVYRNTVQQLQQDKESLRQELTRMQEQYTKIQSSIVSNDGKQGINRCQALHEEISSLKTDMTELQNQNTFINCKLEDTSQELHETKDELFTLKEEKCDLEINIAESDVFCQALQEHVDELEGICSTMRLQREEQIHYYNQRESMMKQNFEHEQSRVLKEKSDVAAQLMQLSTEHVLVKDELTHLTEARSNWIHEKNNLRTTIQELETSVKHLEKDLLYQQEHNSKLLKSQKQGTRKERDTEHSTSPSQLPENIKRVIDDYIGERKEILSSFNSTKHVELQKQLVQLKVELQKEKDAHQVDQSEINKLQVSLKKAERRALAGTQASLNSSYSLKQRSNLKPSVQTVDEIFSSQDLSWDNQSIDSDFSFVNEPCMLHNTSAAFDQVTLADKAAIEKLQKLAII